MLYADLKGKNILITSGGTREYIDDVRFITNVSTGKLGRSLAYKAAAIYGAHVHFVRTKGSADFSPEDRNPVPFFHNGATITRYEVTDAACVEKTVKRILKRKKIDAVIMTMAVADWGFKKKAKTLSSDSKEEFIAYLEKNMVRNPKIIESIKEVSPETFLVGFKFMVGYEHKALIKLAREKQKQWGADLVVANDKDEMKKEGEHIAHLVRPGIRPIRVVGKDNISKSIIDIIKKGIL